MQDCRATKCITFFFFLTLSVNLFEQARAKNHSFPFERRSDKVLVPVEIYNRKKYNDIFENQTEEQSPYTQRNIFVENLKCCLFPPWISPPDACHTQGLGWDKWLIKMLSLHYPNEFSVLVELSNNIYIPRYSSSYIQSLKFIKNWKAKDYIFAGEYTLPLLVFIIFNEQEPLIVECFVNQSFLLSRVDMNNKETLNLQLLKFYEKQWYLMLSNLGKYFRHVYFSANVHRLSHLFRFVILYGRREIFSLFAHEGKNALSVRGVSGTQNPLESITRNYEKEWIYNKALKSLTKHSLFQSDQFLPSRKIFFPKDFKKKDKNPKNLTKVYLQGTNNIKFYLEPYKRELNRSHTRNCYISFENKGYLCYGIIKEILFSSEVNNERVESHDSQSEDQIISTNIGDFSSYFDENDDNDDNDQVVDLEDPLEDSDSSIEGEEIDYNDDHLYLRVKKCNAAELPLPKANFFEVFKKEKEYIVKIEKVMQVFGCFTLKKEDYKRYFFIDINKTY